MKDAPIKMTILTYKKIRIIASMLLISSLSHCMAELKATKFEILTNGFEIKFGVESISVNKLKQIKKNNTPLLLIDVRSPAEQSVSIIPDAILTHPDRDPWQLKQIQDFLLQNQNNPNSKIIFYCAVGYRSSKSISQLFQSANVAMEQKKSTQTRWSIQGNKIANISVLNLHGGIFEYANQGHSLYTKGPQNTTNLVHAYGASWVQYIKPPAIAVLKPKMKN